MKRMLAVSLAVVLSLSLAAYRKNAALSESTAERKTIPQSTTAPLPAPVPMPAPTPTPTQQEETAGSESPHRTFS